MVDHWLFVCGLSLELSGAVLVAWTIFARTPDETREEAVTRYDANLWMVVFREREQAFVRAGLLLLSGGILLQLAGVVIQINGWSKDMAVPVAVAVFLASLIAARRLAEHSIPITYSSLPAEGLEDERHSFNLSSLQDVDWWRRHWVEHISNKQLTTASTEMRPIVNHGRWAFQCSCEPGVSNVATPGLPTVVCLKCGQEYKAEFPEQLEEIERVLMLRPRANRNWSGDESMDDLKRENRGQDLPE